MRGTLMYIVRRTDTARAHDTRYTFYDVGTVCYRCRICIRIRWRASQFVKSPNWNGQPELEWATGDGDSTVGPSGTPIVFASAFTVSEPMYTYGANTLAVLCQVLSRERFDRRPYGVRPNTRRVWRTAHGIGRRPTAPR